MASLLAGITHRRANVTQPAVALRIPSVEEYERLSWYAKREAASTAHLTLRKRALRERRIRRLREEQERVQAEVIAEAAVLLANLPRETDTDIAGRHAVLNTMTNAPRA
jgi:hypothetical protein